MTDLLMKEESLKDKTAKGTIGSGIDTVVQFGVTFIVNIAQAHQYVFRASPNGYQNGQLARLNRELDSLYETIYNEWATITEEDYKVFGGQLQLLILTVKQLYDACRKLPKENGLKAETRKLGMNYSALYELNSDIVNFRIKLPPILQVCNPLED